MSALTVKTAKERAKIAVRMLKNNKDLGRSFDNCFEMNDGEYVKLYLLKWAETDHVLMYCLRKAFTWSELNREAVTL